jgi:hypothetical protein
MIVGVSHRNAAQMLGGRPVDMGDLAVESRRGS